MWWCGGAVVRWPGGVVWCGMELYGVLWSGMVGCGSAVLRWCGGVVVWRCGGVGAVCSGGVVAFFLL